MCYRSVDRCRVCNSGSLANVLSIGDHYVNDFPERGRHLDGIRIPIELDLCDECGLVQARNTPPPELLYKRFYWYRSGVTDTMRVALQDVVCRAKDCVELSSDDVVLDIGSNDGTLLRCYSLYPCAPPHTIGVEPADNLQSEGSRGITKLIHDFWPLKEWKYKKARIITAIGMFYDLDDPNPFVAGVADTLAYDGVFIAQLMCLRDMVELGDVGNFSHEHLEFYSLRSLIALFEKHGLEIFEIERNNINGSSHRLYVRHKGSPVGFVNEVLIQQHLEEEWDYCNPSMYADLSKKMEKNRDECVNFIRDEVEKGKTVWVYGASTKGNTILQYYELSTKEIVAASERSPEKWGRCTVGTGIPIYSEEVARLANPDYFLVLPYAFIDEFVEREKDWHGKFLVPLPEFTIV